MRRMCATEVICVLSLLASAAQASAKEEKFGSSLANSGGNLHTGWYPNQSALSPELVSGGTFGQLWSAPVEGQAYAQPLLDDGTLLVATEKNNLYGQDPKTQARHGASRTRTWPPKVPTAKPRASKSEARRAIATLTLALYRASAVATAIRLPRVSLALSRSWMRLRAPPDGCGFAAGARTQATARAVRPSSAQGRSARSVVRTSKANQGACTPRHVCR